MKDAFLLFLANHFSPGTLQEKGSFSLFEDERNIPRFLANSSISHTLQEKRPSLMPKMRKSHPHFLANPSPSLTLQENAGNSTRNYGKRVAKDT
jgi:hypothetical protein